MTAMCERALVYSTEEYAHRTLVLYEAAALREGIEDNLTAYFVRSLLSEGRIEYPVTVRDKDGSFTTKTIVKEGPTNLIVTTTKIAGPRRERDPDAVAHHRRQPRADRPGAAPRSPTRPTTAVDLERVARSCNAGSPPRPSTASPSPTPPARRARPTRRRAAPPRLRDRCSR